MEVEGFFKICSFTGEDGRVGIIKVGGYYMEAVSEESADKCFVGVDQGFWRTAEHCQELRPFTDLVEGFVNVGKAEGAVEFNA